MAKQLGIWLVMFLGLMALYNGRENLASWTGRLGGEIVPGVAIESGPSEVTLRAASDGHFYAFANVNGVGTRLMVDTGASTVVLSDEAAQALGIETGNLFYDVQVSTANGTTRAARIRLDQIEIGGITVRGVEAMVARPGAMSGSLLGMSYLRRLKSFEFAGSRLILRA